MSDAHLSTYLNDHLAGATLGLELARRTRRENTTGELAGFLDRFILDLEAEKQLLRQLVEAIGAREDTVKQAVGWLAEKAGRLKLNDRITGYSDLSRMEELEALLLGSRGRQALWAALRATHSTDPRLSSVEFERLEGVAATHVEQLEIFRLQAAAQALG